MLDLEVEKQGEYYTLSIAYFAGVEIYSGLIDEKEAVDVACQLIRAAEELLPATCVQEEIKLAGVREELEK